MALFSRKAKDAGKEAANGITRNGFINNGKYRLRIDKYILARSGNPDTPNKVKSVVEVEVLETFRTDEGEYKGKAWKSQQPGDLATILETVEIDSNGNLVGGYKTKYAFGRIVEFCAAMVGATVDEFEDEDMEGLGGPSNPLHGIEFTLDVRSGTSEKGAYYQTFSYSDVAYPDDE